MYFVLGKHKVAEDNSNTVGVLHVADNSRRRTWEWMKASIDIARNYKSFTTNRNR